MLGCDVNVRVGAGRRSQSAVERKFPKTATRCGQRSEVAAVMTLTHLAGCMIAQRGMLRRPDGLLATVTQRAMEGGDGGAARQHTGPLFCRAGVSGGHFVLAAGHSHAGGELPRTVCHHAIREAAGGM